MKMRKLNIAVLFLTSSATLFYAQEVKKDTLQKEQNVEGVVIKASGNKISGMSWKAIGLANLLIA